MLTFWLKNLTIRLTQLQPREPGRYQGSCGWDFIQLRRHPPWQGQRHRAIPNAFACTQPGDGHRLMTSVANCDRGTLDISSKGSTIPRFTRPSPGTGWQQGEP